MERRLPYDPALDGLRGVAVAAVVAFHLGAGWAAGGFLGVSAFFTLSGFLITSLLLAEHKATGRIELRQFWVRRIRRLQPLAVLTLAGVVVFAAAVAAPLDVPGIRGDVLAALGQVANWRFVLDDRSYADLFAEPSPVQHFWSLAVEEQLYVALPLAVVALCRLARARPVVIGGALAVLAVVSASASALLFVPGSPDRAYYGTDTRAAEVLVGAVLAVVLAARPRRAALPPVFTIAAAVGVVALAVAWSTAVVDDAWLYRGGLLGHAIVVAVVIAASRQDGRLRTALSLRPLVALGRISYGVYLVHWPVLLWLTPARTGLEGVPLTALRLLVTLAISVTAHRLVEEPVRRGRALRGRRAWVAAPAPVAVAVAVIAVAVARPAPTIVFQGDAAPPPVAVDRQVSASAHDAGKPVETEAARREGGPAPTSADASPARPARVLVVGDSVAAALGAGFDEWGRTTGLAHVWNAGRQYCGIGRGGLTELTHSPPAPGCEDWPDRWASQLDQFDPDIVVVLSTIWDMSGRMQEGWGDYLDAGDPVFDEWITAEWQAAADLLGSRGARVVWLNVPCQRSGPDEAPAWTRHMNEHVVPALRGVRVVDLFAMVCPDGRFVDAYEGHDGTRPDGLHFSVEGGSLLAADILGPLVDRLPSIP